MRVLSLDPSVNNVGWCLFNNEKKKRKNAWKWGLIHPQGLNYTMRLYDLIQQLAEHVGDFDILVTEWPAFFSSEKGTIAAHQNYTIDLAGICMYIAGWHHMNHKQHFPVTATAWKGTVQKHVTSVKFFRTFGISPARISEHSIDAVMLLHYWLSNYGEKALKLNGSQLMVNLV